MNAPSTLVKIVPSVQNGNQGKERPPKGHLETLPTKAETETRFNPIQAFITMVSPRGASHTLKAIDDALRGAQPRHVQPLQHLRRFVRPEYLPGHLTVDLAAPPISQKNVASVNSKGKEEEHLLNEVVATSPGTPLLHLLVCATTDLTLEQVKILLASNNTLNGKTAGPPVSIITVPGLPPTSEAQAKKWSQEYWPTTYKKHNPFGAHPAIISRAVAELEETVDEFMDLARKVGREAVEAYIGEEVGVVAIRRGRTGRPSVIMAAGDARWNLLGKRSSPENANGNVMAHAVMRTIALVAKKLQDVSSPPTTGNNESDAFTDLPLTQSEKKAYAESSIQPGGYLCLDLEFYLTHEPCVMCSMALLHSRVGRAVFEKRMPLTGGLTASDGESQAEHAPGLGYGLFWRPSLNWKFLTWQWRPDNPYYASYSIDEKTHA